MNGAAAQLSISYFGKLPSRGDFVKAGGNHQLVSLLDRWAGTGIELMSRDTAWKNIYDAARPMHFVFLGSRNPVAIAGHFVPSRDASERRFPFLSAMRLDLNDPLKFMARAPLALSRPWTRLERQSRVAVLDEEPGEALRTLAETPLSVTLEAAAYDAPYADFLEIESVGSLDALLQQAGHQVSVRRIFLALGILLQPVMSSGAARLEKGLALPIPGPGPHQALVATLWCDLLSRFLGRADFELLVLLGGVGAPMLTVGFNDGHGQALHSMLDPQMHDENNIVLDDPDWADDNAEDDHALHKLASYLDHEDLSLRMARDTFAETFLGE